MQPSSSRFPTLSRFPSLARFVTLLAGLLVLATGHALAHDNEVYRKGGSFRWKVNGTEKGRTRDLATALQNCLNAGPDREIHITCGGSLSKEIRTPPKLTLDFHNQTLTNAHGGHAFTRNGGGSLSVSNLKLVNTGGGYGFRLSRASDVSFSGIHIDGGGIGIRIDSHPSRPYERGRWIRNVRVVDCTFENLGSHGLETYGIDGFVVDNIISKNCAHCGVLINRGINGRIGTVKSYRCSHGGGYAGLRFANDCADITVKSLVALECGRGFFTVSRIRNVVVDEVRIRDCTGHALLIQHSDGVIVRSGTYNGVGLNHYTSRNCEINAVPLGVRRIDNAGSGKALDLDAGDSKLIQWTYKRSENQKWKIAEAGDGLFTIRSAMAGEKALAAPAQPANGDHPALTALGNHPTTRWRIQSVGDSRFRLTPASGPRSCLTGSGKEDGDEVVLWNYHDDPSQQWSIGQP